MTWINWILAYVFDCVHRRTTWPHRDRRGLDYVCCLECGRELPYSMRWMCIVTSEEQLEDRAPLADGARSITRTLDLSYARDFFMRIVKMDLLRRALLMAVVVFYSKNVVSTVIRALISF